VTFESELGVRTKFTIVSGRHLKNFFVNEDEILHSLVRGLRRLNVF